MKEAELKILGIDVPRLVMRLEELGAKKGFDGLMKVHYFDYPDGRINEKGDLLRVRELSGSESRAEVAYKANKRIEDGMKVFDEYEFTAPDSGAIIEIFRNLGLVETLYFEKKRIEYVFSATKPGIAVKVEIDEYPKTPAYCELEATDRETLDLAIGELGLSGFETSTETVAELFANRYPDISLNGLCF